ncbi:MAG: TetR/AcrR family transcriptional regulator [Novosphingobium sp.]
MLEANGTRKPRPRKGSLAHLTDRNAVVKAAAVLFDRRGYVETTMQDIADRLKISKPTLYRHAKSKSDILQLIINHWIDQSDQALRDAANLPDVGERIPFIVRQWTHNAVTNSAHLKVFLSSEQDMPPKAVRRYREWSGKVYGLFRDMIAEGQSQGLYRAEADPTVAAFAILGFILLLPRWLSSSGRMSPAQVAEEYLKNWACGLQAP